MISGASVSTHRHPGSDRAIDSRIARDDLLRIAPVGALVGDLEPPGRGAARARDLRVLGDHGRDGHGAAGGREQREQGEQPEKNLTRRLMSAADHLRALLLPGWGGALSGAVFLDPPA